MSEREDQETIIARFENHLHFMIQRHGSMEDMEWFTLYRDGRNKFKKALEFYADEGNYRADPGMPSTVEWDSGKCARQALKGSETT